MIKILNKLFGNSILLALVGLATAALALVFLFLVFSSGPAEQEAVQESSNETAEIIMATGEISQIFITNLPAPILAPEEGAVLGYVFLDVTIDVIGDDARERAQAGIATLQEKLSTAMTEKGAGMAGQPGVVDVDRLAGLFSHVAGAEVGPEYIAGVVVLPVDEG